VTKAELRKRYLRERKSISLSTIADASKKIADRLFSTIDLRNAENLHTFIRIARLNEIDTSAIYFRLWRDLPRLGIYAPRSDMATGEMASVKFTPATEIIESDLGIREPAGPAVDNDAIFDIVLVPLIVCDASGQRVGYGKGFYDRFLAKCRKDCLKIGLGIFEPVDAVTDANDNDIRLDMYIMPDAVLDLR